MNNLEHLISRYIDNELSKTEQHNLFEQLVNNLEAQTTLHSFIKIDKEATSFYSSNYKLFPNKNININRKATFTINAFTLLKYAAIIFLFVSSLFLLYQTNNYSKQLEQASSTMEKQSETIKVLINSLPPVKVTPNGNDIIIRTNL